MNIVVLGGGRTGSAIARDLVADGEFTATVVDASAEIVARFHGIHDIATLQVHLDDPRKVKRVVRRCDLVVNALPGEMGFETLRAVLECGINVVDLSFSEEDPTLLDSVAKANKATAVVDCGVAPGLSNMILGHLNATLDQVNRFECSVGGLPVDRLPPWEYKATFSPIDVISEYTRQARCVKGGEQVTSPALSEVELIEFPEVGTLEAFNTDGLRTLLKTMKIPFMRQRTLRYPGHAEKVALLRDAGFFDRTPIEVGEGRIRPIDVTAALLFPQWQLGPGEQDFTAMRLDVDGVEDGVPVRYRFELLDRYDRETGISSMARTSGYSCAAVARLVARGKYARPGISPPEFVGRDLECFQSVRRDLAARGVVFDQMRSTATGEEEGQRE